jgi:hypothetical protein
VSRRLLWATLALLATGAAPAQDPRVDYMLQCQGCHLADGSGSPGAVPDLRATLPELAAAAGAREYLVRVPGVAQAALPDARLAALLDWLLREFAPAQAAGFAPYRAEEVARWRAHPYAEVEPVRRELLRAAACRTRDREERTCSASR